VARKTYQECLEIPEGLSVGNVIGRGGSNVKKLYAITKSCYIEVEKKKVLIITNGQGKLPQRIEKMQQILFQESYYATSQCFINPRGATRYNSYHFRELDGPMLSVCSTTMYELYGSPEQEGEITDVVSPADKPPADPHTSRKKKKARATASKGAEPMAKPLLHLNTKEDVRDCLTKGLQMLVDEKGERKFIIQLSARLGKVMWSRFEGSVYRKDYSLEGLVQLLSSKSSMGKNIFNPIVESAGVRHLRSSFSDNTSHSIEVFDVKGDFACGARGLEGGTRLDIRLVLQRSVKGQAGLQVVMVRRNEAKEIGFDVLHLERQYDIRIGLYNYEYVTEGEPLHAVVREMVGTLSFPARHLVQFKPKMARWNIHVLRCKRKTTFLLDDRFAATVNCMSEHTFDVEKGQVIELDLKMEQHTEVELHNLAWECAFGRDAGFSSNQALSLLIERGSVNTREFDLLPRPWQVDHIIRDFDNFWGHLEFLTDKLDELD
jgi:hypothetical protein